MTEKISLPPRDQSEIPGGEDQECENQGEDGIAPDQIIRFPKRSFSALITDRETFAVMSGMLQFIDHSHGIVFNGDMTYALFIHDQIVQAEAEFPRALSGFE